VIQSGCFCVLSQFGFRGGMGIAVLYICERSIKIKSIDISWHIRQIAQHAMLGGML
jgi:hypothetical protein